METKFKSSQSVLDFGLCIAAEVMDDKLTCNMKCAPKSDTQPMFLQKSANYAKYRENGIRRSRVVSD
jgi:hypothetical protein